MDTLPKIDKYEMAFKVYRSARTAYIATQVLLSIFFVLAIACLVIMFTTVIENDNATTFSVAFIAILGAAILFFLYAINKSEKNFSARSSFAPQMRFLLAFFNPEEVQRYRLVKFTSKYAVVEIDGCYRLKINRQTREYLYGCNDVHRLSFDSMLRPHEMVEVAEDRSHTEDDFV